MCHIVCCQIALVAPTYDICDKEGEPADNEDPHDCPKGLGCFGLLGEPEPTSMTALAELLNVTVSRFCPQDFFRLKFLICTYNLVIHVLLHLTKYFYRIFTCTVLFCGAFYQLKGYKSGGGIPAVG